MNTASHNNEPGGSRCAIASHNTMSFLKPQWWLRPFAFMAKCQSKGLHDQYHAGARMFDLRIAFERDGTPYFAHGLASYKGVNVYKTLNWLSMMSRMHKYDTGELVIVRVLNESNTDEARFADFCREIDEKYVDIQFCGFRNKNNKGQMWEWRIRGQKGCGLGDTGHVIRKTSNSYFESKPASGFRINFINKYSSDNCTKHNDGHCTGRWYDDLFPRIYAMLFNKKNRSTFADAPGFLMQDFVGVY